MNAYWKQLYFLLQLRIIGSNRAHRGLTLPYCLPYPVPHYAPATLAHFSTPQLSQTHPHLWAFSVATAWYDLSPGSGLAQPFLSVRFQDAEDSILKWSSRQPYLQNHPLEIFSVKSPIYFPHDMSPGDYLICFHGYYLFPPLDQFLWAY